MLVREPFHRDGWVYEEKVDGWRMLAYKDGHRVRLVSRNGRDHTRRFADLAAAVAGLSARTLVLDGEVAIYDQQLRSRFDWLREPETPAVPPALAQPDTSTITSRALWSRRIIELAASRHGLVARNSLAVLVPRASSSARS
jgi:hypothetical protein